MRDDAEHVFAGVREHLGGRAPVALRVVATRAKEGRRRTLREQLCECSIGSAECPGFLEVERESADRLTPVNERRCDVGLHVPQLTQALDAATVQSPELRG